MTYIPKKNLLTSPFGEQITVERTPIIELNSSYGVTNLRDLTETTNTGSISSSNSEIVLSTGTTASSSAHIDSAEIGRYIPGYSAEIGVGIRLDTLPTGEQEAVWGGKSPGETDGIYFGHDSTDFFIATLRSSTETKVARADWNIDKLDGTGPSGVQLDKTQGTIFQIMYTWYGYGDITFGVIKPINGVQTFTPCHTISGFNATSILKPNLQIHAQVKNNATASDLTVYVGGRQFSIIGRYIPKYRLTGEWRDGLSTTTTVKPLVSLKRKSGFNDRSVKLQSIEVLADTEDCVAEIRLGPTLTGATFGTPTNTTASETCLESDTSATAVSGGDILYSTLIKSGVNKNSSQFNQSDMDLDIPNGSTVSLCIRTLSGTGSATGLFRMKEEW